MNHHHSVEPIPETGLDGFIAAVRGRYAQQKIEASQDW